MKIAIQGSPEKIAAFVLALQKQHDSGVDRKQLGESIIHLRKSLLEPDKQVSEQSPQIHEPL